MVGERLCDDAVWHEDRASWTGDLPSETGEAVHRSLTGDLYTGTSGVGWFLAHLWRATGEERFGVTARGALAHALSRAAPWGDPGLLTGSTGVALAVVSAAAALGDERLSQQGTRLVADALDTMAKAHEPDLTNGCAGIILGLLALRSAVGDAAVDVAMRLGVHLTRTAEPAVLGRAWPSNGEEAPLCGLAHGVSGPALALMELGGEVRDAAAVAAASDAFAVASDAFDYERAWFNRSQGGWPDLREVRQPAPSEGLSHPAFWCHGSAGIGLVRLVAWTRTGDERLLAEAAAAIDHATAVLLRSTASAGGNLSLCHGAGSVAELHLAAAALTRHAEHVDHARRLVARALCRPTGDWRDGLADVPCGVPGGGETPGLFLGLAGVGTTLLRLADLDAAPCPALPHLWTAG